MVEQKKHLDYSRIESLMSKVCDFVDTLPEELNEENGFELLLIAHDVQNKTSGVYTLVNADDERESLIRCIDNAISAAAFKGAEKNPQEWKTLNALAEYLMRLCAMFPSLYENFKKGVEKYKK